MLFLTVLEVAKAREYLRRVQLTGRSSLTVSLPKDWVKAVGIRPGSLVRMSPGREMVLMISPAEAGKRGFHKEFQLKLGDMKPDEAVRELISVYQAGYDIIRLKLTAKAPILKPAIKDTVRRRLMGMEILSESANEMLMQCFTQHMEFPLPQAIVRSAEISSSMCEDAINAFLGKNGQLASEVIQRDDEVDRLFHYIIRQLNVVLDRPAMIEGTGIEVFNECLSFFAIAKSMERIGDHASSIAQISLELREKFPDTLASEIAGMGKGAQRGCKLSMQGVLDRVEERASGVVGGGCKQIRPKYERTVEKVMKWKIAPRSVSLTKTVLEHLMRIAEYSADIAEQAIFLSIIRQGRLGSSLIANR